MPRRSYVWLAVQVVVGIDVFCNEAPIDIFSSIGPVAYNGTATVNIATVRAHSDTSQHSGRPMAAQLNYARDKHG